MGSPSRGGILEQLVRLLECTGETDELEGEQFRIDLFVKVAFANRQRDGFDDDSAPLQLLLGDAVAQQAGPVRRIPARSP